MKNKVVAFIFLMLAGSGAGTVMAQSDKDELNAIQTVVPFLTIAPDSRSGAMGDAGVATSPDCFSMHWNPAKLAFIDGKGGLGISYSPWLRALVPDINVAYLTGYKRIDAKQTIGASLTYNAYGEVQFTDDFGNIIMTFRANEFAIDGSYARLFSEHFSGGVAMRFIYSNLTGGIQTGGTETKPGISFAADLAMYYQAPYKIGSKDAHMSYGLNFSNIGSKMTYTDSRDPDFIPMNMKLGTAQTIELDSYNKITLALDFNKLLVPTPPKKDANGNIIDGKDPNVSVPVAIFQSFYDAPGGFYEEIREITISAGAEYWYNNIFAIRAGYFHESEMKGNRKYFTAGAGFRLNIFSLDFSYLVPVTQNNPLAQTLRFSLSFDFNSFRNVKKG